MQWQSGKYNLGSIWCWECVLTVLMWLLTRNNFFIKVVRIFQLPFPQLTKMDGTAKGSHRYKMPSDMRMLMQGRALEWMDLFNVYIIVQLALSQMTDENKAWCKQTGSFWESVWFCHTGWVKHPANGQRLQSTVFWTEESWIQGAAVRKKQVTTWG